MKRQRMKEFTAAVSRCLENHKYENVMSLFARISTAVIVPKNAELFKLVIKA